MEKQFETNPFLIAFEVGAKNGYQNTKPKVTNQFIKSWKYVIWRSEKKKGTCETCKNMDGKLLDIDSITTDLWPAHPNCACKLEKTVAIASGTLTEKGMIGIDNKFIICDDKIRRKAIKICKNVGLYRVQKSIFLGDIEENDFDEVKLRLEDTVDLKNDSVYVFTMSKKELNKAGLIGQAFDKELVTDEIISKFF